MEGHLHVDVSFTLAKDDLFISRELYVSIFKLIFI